jgi:hypothetical protein
MGLASWKGLSEFWKASHSAKADFVSLLQRIHSPVRAQFTASISVIDFLSVAQKGAS